MVKAGIVSSRRRNIFMTTNLQVNDQFPDFSLPDQQNEMVALSRFTKPGLFDRYLGFQDGYPLILVFFRGFFAHAISSRCGNW